MTGAWPKDIDYDKLLHLLQCRTTKSAIAIELGVSRPTLYKVISEYQLEDAASW